jgi:hypothetical protein
MTTRPRVLLVRERVEDREVANYLALPDAFDIRIVTARGSTPYDASGLGLPRITLPSIASRRLGRRAAGFVADRVLAFDPDVLLGLGRHARDADVVCVNETHLASSAQAARLRRRRGYGFRLVTVCYENIPFN